MTALTLSEALKLGKLEKFIAQEEARGVGPIDRAAFDDLAAVLVKATLLSCVALFAASLTSR